MANDLDTLRAGLAPFWVNDAALELRIIKTQHRTVSGYFRNIDTAATALDQAARLYNGNAAFYVTLNPVNPQCHARALDRLKPYAETTTKDADVLRRQYLLIDCDVVRPADISSTDAELAAALAVRDAIVIRPQRRRLAASDSRHVWQWRTRPLSH